MSGYYPFNLSGPSAPRLDFRSTPMWMQAANMDRGTSKVVYAETHHTYDKAGRLKSTHHAKFEVRESFQNVSTSSFTKAPLKSSTINSSRAIKSGSAAATRAPPAPSKAPMSKPSLSSTSSKKVTATARQTTSVKSTTVTQKVTSTTKKSIRS